MNQVMCGVQIIWQLSISIKSIHFLGVRVNSVYEGGKFFGFMIRMHSMAEISNVTLSSKVLQHFLHSLTDFLL